MTAPRRVRRFGDGALVADVDSVGDAHGLAAAVSGPGVGTGSRTSSSATARSRSWPTPRSPTSTAMAAELSRLPAAARHRGPRRQVEIPVAFDGPDLDDVAGLAGTTRAAVVDALVGAELCVAFLGFLPGFAYLDRLPEALAAVPRRSSPRPTVPAGSVALGGGFAGIYPQASPGGWHILGRTGFDALRPRHRPLRRAPPRGHDPAARRRGPRGDGDAGPGPRCDRRGAHGGGGGTGPACRWCRTWAGPAWPGWECPGRGRPTPSRLRAANRLVGNGRRRRRDRGHRARGPGCASAVTPTLPSWAGPR